MVSLAELKRYLNIEHTGEDTLLTEFEAEAVAELEFSTGRYLGVAKAVIEVMDGLDKSMLVATNPLASVTKVEVWGELGEDWETLDASEYEVVMIGVESGALPVGLRRVEGRWPVGLANVRVSYTAGYVGGAEPDRLQLLVKRIVSHRYRGRVKATGQETTQALPEEVLSLIEQEKPSSHSLGTW